MSAIEYGFIDENNLLLEIAIFEDNNPELLDHAKRMFDATSYHVLDNPFGPAVIRKSIWTGDYFTPGCNYSTWIWDNQKEQWVPPVLPPEDEKQYIWSDEQINWIEVI